MRSRIPFVTVIALTLALLLPSGAAAVPRIQMGAPGLTNYQGYLTDDGDPVDGQVDLRFGIYETETSTTALWEETHEDVAVADGHLAVLLGSVTPLSASAFSGTERWLQVSANLDGSYTDLPRQRVTAVPYALQAQEAASAPWGGLTGVPSGLDDGDDDTTYTAGAGLELNGTEFSVSEPLGCRVIAETSQDIAHAVNVPLTFTTVISDTTGGSCWKLNAASILRAPADGYYMAGGAVTFANSQITSAGRVVVTVQLNGAVSIQANDAHTNPNMWLTKSVTTGMFWMDEGDHIEIVVRHNLGSTKSTFPGDTVNQSAVNAWLMKVH